MRQDLAQAGRDLDTDWAEVGWKYYWHTRAHQKMVEQYLHGIVLDVGCGLGFLAASVFPNEGRYTGVDISETAIRMARELFPGARFLRVDVTRQPLPFHDKQFDTVVCSEILEHLVDFRPVLPELQRVSRQYIVITVPTSMGGVGHVWPVWSCEDLHREFGGLGKIIEIRHHYEAHCNLVWIRR